MTFADLAARGLDRCAAGGAAYAEIRYETARAERIEVRNGVVAELSDEMTAGYGIRALVDGAWGFAAGPVLE
ncbi:MAG: PmbA/TldA family metallopeptidase, partial [Vulcanimicrobiaceae bacterium]